MRSSPPGRGRPGRFARLPLLFTLVLLSACDGCAGCGGDARVPFKRPTSEPSPGRALPDGGQDGLGQKAQAGGGSTMLRFVDAPASVTLPSGTLDRGDGHIHAALLRQQKGESDALLLCTDDDGHLSVERSVLGPGGYGRMRRVMTLPMAHGASCQALTGALAQPSDSHLLVLATFTCQRERKDSPDGDEQFLARGLYVLSDEDYPRLLERYQLRDVGSGASPQPGQSLSVAAELDSVDVDGDGHDDLRLTLTPQLGEDSLPTMAFDLIDRPGGLSMSGKEPEKTLRAIADGALSQLQKSPALALSQAQQVRVLHGALCRGAGHAAIQIGGREGLPCERSAALGRALAVAVVAHVRRGELVAALEVQEAMRRPDCRALPVDEKRAENALAKVSRQRRYRFIEGPTVPSRPQPPLHMPQVGFVDSAHLLLRGTPPEDYAIAGGERSPTSVAAPGFAFHDPTGTYVATELVQDCEGDKLLVFGANQVVMGRSVGPPARTLLVTPAEHGGCTALSRPRRIEAGELTLVRWGQQELIFARRGSLIVLPVDAELNSQGPAHALREASSLPSRNEPDSLSIAPAIYPMVTRLGVVLVDAIGRQATLLDTHEVPGPIDTAVLSPNAESIALVVGGRVYIGLPARP